MLSKALQIAATNAGGAGEYIEDVFSTYLYSGIGSTPYTITNGIDLAGEGGLVWIKKRNESSVSDHTLVDTQRGGNKSLATNTTGAQITDPWISSFNSNGFTIGRTDANINATGRTYASWTFRKAPKFFDVVTYTGDDSTSRVIPHSLGCDVGMLVIKCTSINGTVWFVWHRSSNGLLKLNSTDAAIVTSWINSVTDSSFTLGTANQSINQAGATYVAYLFAHDAGGFGDAGNENVISCGSFVPSSTWGSVIDIGFEPQWLLYKKATGLGEWNILDNMRGIATGGADNYLTANSSDSEIDYVDSVSLHAKGFQQTFSSVDTNTYIYIAIRRPMKTPESGTEVFSAVTYTGTSATRSITTNILTDLAIYSQRDKVNELLTTFASRLASPTVGMSSTGTDAEYSISGDEFFGITSNQIGISDYNNRTGRPYINWNFRRASGFFDVVCYTGNGVAGRTVAHNLTVAPELMIVRVRNDANDWVVYHKNIGASNILRLNSTTSIIDKIAFADTTPTESVFYVDGRAGFDTNFSAKTYVAYLFATLDGVSKVGSYTGNGSSQTINCGFTGGARFILIKRTDASGDWYVWDSARGIVAGNDPRLSLNTSAAEVTTDDSVDVDSSGFIVNQVAATNVNVNAASYIFLAIA